MRTPKRRVRQEKASPAWLALGTGFAAAGLISASLETIWRRNLMILRGTCPPEEYRRMIAEKSAAAAETAGLLIAGRHDAASLMKPWSRRAAANAKRLRKADNPA